MQALVDAENGGFELAAWDWAFYAEKVRQARYAFDDAQLQPYFELNRVLLDGVFYAASRLYGLTFKERHDLPVYEPNVRVFDVFDADGSPLGALPRRLLRAPEQERRRLDERLRAAVEPARHEARHRQPPQHPAAAGGRADAAHPRRGADDVPRVRPRAARHVLEREVPALRRHERAARLRRVPLAGERDVGDVARGAGELRQALPDRRADPAGAARQGARRREVQPGLRRPPSSWPPT